MNDYIVLFMRSFETKKGLRAAMLAAMSQALLFSGCVGDLPAAPETDSGSSADATVVLDGSPREASPSGDAPPASDASEASVTDAPIAGFTLTVSGSRTSVVRGSSAQILVTVVSVGGFAGPVTITVSGLPPGVTADSLVVPSGATSGTLTLQATATATLTADAQLVLSGAADALTASVSLPLTVQDPSGTLDVTFGTNGVSVIPVYALNPYGAITGIAFQPDGKIVYGGSAPYQGNYYLFLGRLNEDGSADPTFNPSAIAPPGLSPPPPPGMVVMLPTGDATFNCGAPVILPSGEIVLAGFLNPSGQNHEMMVAELTSTGVLDTDFAGGNGYLSIGTNDVDSKAGGLLVEANGDLVLAGFLGSSPAITRLLPSGAPDTTFAPATTDGGIGFDTFPSFSGSFGTVLPLANGDWVTALSGANGNTADLIAIAPASGKVDSQFGTGGAATATFGAPTGIFLVAADGSIVVAGSSASSQDAGSPGTTIELARFNAAGQLDVGSFGTQGIATPQIPGINASADSIAEASDGKLLVGATLSGSASIGVVRYTSAGALDTTFAAGAAYAGVTQSDSSTIQATTVVGLDAAGRIVIANNINIPENTDGAGLYGAPALEVARFWP